MRRTETGLSESNHFNPFEFKKSFNCTFNSKLLCFLGTNIQEKQILNSSAEILTMSKIQA